MNGWHSHFICLVKQAVLRPNRALAASVSNLVRFSEPDGGV